MGDIHEEHIEKQRIIKFIKESRLPYRQGLSEHGKGFREGANTVLKVLELLINKKGKKCGRKNNG